MGFVLSSAGCYLRRKSFIISSLRPSLPGKSRAHTKPFRDCRRPPCRRTCNAFRFRFILTDNLASFFILFILQRKIPFRTDPIIYQLFPSRNLLFYFTGSLYAGGDTISAYHNQRGHYRCLPRYHGQKDL